MHSAHEQHRFHQDRSCLSCPNLLVSSVSSASRRNLTLRLSVQANPPLGTVKAQRDGECGLWAVFREGNYCFESYFEPCCCSCCVESPRKRLYDVCVQACVGPELICSGAICLLVVSIELFAQNSSEGGSDLESFWFKSVSCSLPKLSHYLEASQRQRGLCRRSLGRAGETSVVSLAGCCPRADIPDPRFVFEQRITG